MECDTGKSRQSGRGGETRDIAQQLSDYKREMAERRKSEIKCRRVRSDFSLLRIFEKRKEVRNSDNTEGETEIVGVRGDFVAHVRRNY